MKYHKRYILHLCFTFVLVSFLSNVKQMEFMQNSSFWIWHVPFYFSWFVSISSSLQMAIDWWNVQWVMICVFKSNNNICENMWWSNMFQTFLWISTQDNYFQIIHSSKKSGFSAAAVFINQFAHIPTFFDMYHLVRRDFRWFYFHYIRKYSADFYHMPILICLLIKTNCGTRIKEIFF